MAHPERSLARTTEWRKANPVRRKQILEKWRKANPGKWKMIVWANNLKRQHGLSLQQYNSMLSKQGGVCAICGKSDKTMLAVDHDHSTNRIRGLLCTRCNPGLGFFGDSKDNLVSAVRYLHDNRWTSREHDGVTATLQIGSEVAK